MPIYYYLLLCTILLALGFLIHAIFIAKANIPIKLFLQGIKRENEGHLEEAALIYFSAYKEFKKIRSHSKLTHAITGKLRLLSSVMDEKRALSLKKMMALNREGLKSPILYGTSQTREFFQNCILRFNLN
jgi:hypothetical protein